MNAKEARELSERNSIRLRATINVDIEAICKRGMTHFVTKRPHLNLEEASIILKSLTDDGFRASWDDETKTFEINW